MTNIPKYILHCPVSDDDKLEKFVESCLAEKASLLAIVGSGCAQLENIIDEIVIGDGNDDSRFLCTTSHPDETLEEVLSFVKAWEFDQAGDVIQVRI